MGGMIGGGGGEFGTGPGTGGGTTPPFCLPVVLTAVSQGASRDFLGILT